MTIAVSGLSIYTHHGVGAAEREVGQRLVLDVDLELAECEACDTDELADTVNYSDVCEQAAQAATERQYRTLERLCAVICERLSQRYEVQSVRVRATKPEPPIALAVQSVSVEVCRTRRFRP